MDTHLAVTLTRAYNRRPLAVVHNLPGQDAELFPDQLRALAAALVAAADAADAAAASSATATGQSSGLDLRGGIRAEFGIGCAHPGQADPSGVTATRGTSPSTASGTASSTCPTTAVPASA
jgi:hypothetical protein